jgi:hypothetical protein
MSTALAEISNWFTDEVVRPPAAAPERQTRLQKLPPLLWRSLGGYLDYTDWSERDRFVYLDMEIRAHQIQQARMDAHSRDSRAA